MGKIRGTIECGNGLLMFVLFCFSCGFSDNDQLFISAGSGDISAVKALLARGADPNHRYRLLQTDFQPYETPIIAAAENGHLDVVKLLVESGADLETRNTHTSETALFKAVKNRHRKVIEYLLEKGADPMTEESFGKNILMMAIEQDDFELIKLLVRYGAWPDPSEVDSSCVAGSVGQNAIELSMALKRPYTGYLQQALLECRTMLKTRTSCRRF